MTKRTRKAALIVCIVMLILSIGIICYPAFSSWYNEKVRSEVYFEYKEEYDTTDATDSAEREAVRAAAEEWNARLYAREIDYLDTENNGYYDQLEYLYNGIMGYVIIPRINVTLPVYHGTSDAVLKAGAGHMPQSSLPVGGENTHTVITAHSGMASNAMFTDLELLEVGDFFQLEVLGEVLTYEVYDIEIVLPEETDSIQIIKGEDLATLITCTPYGVNTHRLLVHGTRIPTPEVTDTDVIEDEREDEQTDSVWENKYYQSILIGLIIGGCIILIIIIMRCVVKAVQARKTNKTESMERQNQ